VWSDQAWAFSKPVSSDERRSAYVPTQILAEAFRSHLYDGIIYKSLREENGKNVVLFDPRLAEPTTLQLFETKALSFEFAPREAAWPVREKGDRQRGGRDAIADK
jgi:hypothetical protein